MGKAQIRQDVLKARNQLTAQFRTLADSQIMNHLQYVLLQHDLVSLHIYTAQRSTHEVPTEWIHALCEQSLPDVTITNGQASPSAVIPTESFSAIVVPIVAFDEHCNRLGYGGGWYDRFLSNQPQALTIGLAYDVQKVSSLPIEPHDIPLSMVITENGIYSA